MVPLPSEAGDGNSDRTVVKQEVNGFNRASVVLGLCHPRASGSPHVTPLLCWGHRAARQHLELGTKAGGRGMRQVFGSVPATIVGYGVSGAVAKSPAG